MKIKKTDQFSKNAEYIPMSPQANLKNSTESEMINRIFYSFSDLDWIKNSNVRNQKKLKKSDIYLINRLEEYHTICNNTITKKEPYYIFVPSMCVFQIVHISTRLFFRFSAELDTKTRLAIVTEFEVDRLLYEYESSYIGRKRTQFFHNKIRSSIGSKYFIFNNMKEKVLLQESFISQSNID